MTRSLGMLFSVSTSMADISALFVYHIDIRISIRNNYKGLLCTSWESSPGHRGCCSRRPPAWPTYLRRFCIILIEEFQSETTIKLYKGPLVSSAHAQYWRMRSAMVCEIGLSNPFFRIVRHGDEADTDLDMDWNYREKIKSLDSGTNSKPDSLFFVLIIRELWLIES